MSERGNSGDGCDLASTLCKYDLIIVYLFVLSWVRVRRIIYLELLMCGGGVCSILLFPLVARCLETIDVCIWRMFDFMSVFYKHTDDRQAQHNNNTSIAGSYPTT